MHVALIFMARVCRGYVRNLGLSANQVLHIPGAGDFTIKQMQVLEKPPPLGLAHKGQANGNSASAMEVSASQHFILPNPEQQEQLARENEADDLVASRPGQLIRCVQRPGCSEQKQCLNQS